MVDLFKLRALYHKVSLCPAESEVFPDKNDREPPMVTYR